MLDGQAIGEKLWTLREALAHARDGLIGETYMSGPAIYPLTNADPNDQACLQLEVAHTGSQFRLRLVDVRTQRVVRTYRPY